MQRTDSEILQWTAKLFEPGDEPFKEDALLRIEGAFSCGLTGRAALEAAMGAVLLEPGEPMPPLTGIQRIAIEVEQGDRSTWPETDRYDGPNGISAAVQLGAALAVEIDRELEKRISGTVTITAEAIAKDYVGIDNCGKPLTPPATVGVDMGSPDGDCTVKAHREEDGTVVIDKVERHPWNRGVCPHCGGYEHPDDACPL